MVHAFCVVLKLCLLEDFSAMISSISFIILVVFHFYVWYEVKIRYSFLYDESITPAPQLKNLLSPPFNYIGLFAKNQLIMYTEGAKNVYTF